MRRYLLYVLFAVILYGCVENVTPTQDSLPNEGMVLEFGGMSFNDVQITTKGTLPGSVENRVVNLYVFIFAADGSCIYSQYYDKESRIESATLPTNRNYCWYVDERDPDNGGGLTNGKIMINSANMPTSVQGEIYIITNLDTELSSLSAARLGLVASKDDLLDVVAVYRKSTSSRLGNFTMVGYGNINIQGGAITSLSCGVCGTTHAGNLIHLERIDAKVQFKIGIIPGAKTKVMEDGNVKYYQVIESFELNSWQVFNLPNGCYLVPQATDAPDSQKNGYFTSNLHSAESIDPAVPIMGFNPTNFTNLTNPNVSTTRKEYGFSFYMYENRQSAKKSVNYHSDYPDVGLYHLRDKRTRNADGTYAASSGDMWEYAPEHGTYLELKGEVKLRHYLPNGTLDQYHIVYSDVVYYIHLGDFGSSSTGTSVSAFDNYSIERNHHYTYTINIKGINSIEVEAERDQNEGYNKSHELQSGAKGDLYAAPLSNNYTFDAHYGQRVFQFKYSDFDDFDDPTQLSWYVSTPFGRKGMPDRVGANKVEVPNGLDYKWVNFHINSGANPQRNFPWPGKNSTEIMDVLDFSNYIREQVTRKRAGQSSDFDLNSGSIYVTVYVDEFYYHSDPISSEVRPAMWKEFVNKPSRIMNIICTSAVSTPGTSSYYKSIVSIRQESIKSIYGNAATEGWGVEAFDEMYGKMKFLNRTHTYEDEIGKTLPGIVTTNSNGFYNSGKLWGLVNASNNFVSGVPWSNFINLAVPNGTDDHTNFMKDDDEISTMRYSCLMRNRDENGNGVIDKDEIKWYLASLGQLRQLFIGDQGLMGQARLYYVADPSNTQATGLNGDEYYKWRSRVISSTIRDNVPIQQWAEEGCSTGPLGHDFGYGKPGIQSIRCVRNLDRDDDSGKDITNPNSYPEPPMTVTKDPVTKRYTFDLSRMNPESLRPKTNNELVPMDEYSLMARPYLKFETGPLCDKNALEQYNNLGYKVLKDRLLKGYSLCPPGYRVPNIREMAIAFDLIDYGDASNNYNDFWDANYAFMCCNYYSFGETAIGGNNYDTTAGQGYNTAAAGCYTWYFKKSSDLISIGYNLNVNATQANITKGLIRCVRDVD